MKKFSLDILLHSSSATTIDLYTQSPMALRIAAQESLFNAILKQPSRRPRIRIARIWNENGILFATLFFNAGVIGRFSDSRNDLLT